MWVIISFFDELFDRNVVFTNKVAAIYKTDFWNKVRFVSYLNAF